MSPYLPVNEAYFYEIQISFCNLYITDPNIRREHTPVRSTVRTAYQSIQ